MTLVVVQARTSSARLPGKVLRPLAGLPLAVLAGLRAANTGLPVVVATSSDPSDDHLASVLAAHAIATYRGDLSDVLGRVVAAIRGEPDDAIIARLTADNVVPDGRLVEAVVKDFERRAVRYLVCNGAESDLPHGVAVEVMRARALREADAATDDPHDREHVTPWIARVYGRQHYRAAGFPHSGSLRCTLDDFEDYQRLTRLFADISEPVTIAHQELIDRLSRDAAAVRHDPSLRTFVLGGAQLGMPYGVTNRAAPGRDEVVAIVAAALARGVEAIDTARAYGDSEERIGEALSSWAGAVPRLVTKLHLDAGAAAATDPAAVERSLEVSLSRSRHALRQATLDTVLLHRAAELSWQNGTVWTALRRHQERGLIGKLGVSVQSPEELDAALAEPGVSHIQLPFNLLDDRWTARLDGLREVRAKRGVTVHIRSALLQGLLTSHDRQLWARAGCVDTAVIAAWLAGEAARLTRRNVVDLCLAYVRSLDWADGIVVGVNSLAQLHDTLNLFSQPPLSPAEAQHVERSRPRIESRVLDPATWAAPTA